jgi:predicted peptidase
MMRTKFPLISIFSFLLLVTILSCSKDDGPAPRTYADIENDFKAIEIKPGTQDLTLKITDNISYSFRVIFPDVDLTLDWPLVLTLHGYAAGSPDAHKQTACYVEPGLAALDVIILSPNGGIDDWETLGNNDQLRILTDLSRRLWPVDVSKVVVTGYSNGGNGSWYYAETQPSIFSAAIPLASGYQIVNLNGVGRKVNIPMYVIHGSEDDLFPLDTVQNWVNKSILAGSDITFVIAQGLGHYTPCDYTSYFQDAAAWLENEVWQ